MKNLMTLSLLSICLGCAPVQKSKVKNDQTQSTETAAKALDFEVSVTDLGHSHIAEARALIKLDIAERSLRKEELDQIRADFATIMVNMRMPGSTLERLPQELMSKPYKEIRDILNGHDQLGLSMALMDITDFASNMGEFNLASRTLSLVGKVSPRLAPFLSSRLGINSLQGKTFDIASPFHMRGTRTLTFTSHMHGVEIKIGYSKAKELLGTAQSPEGGLGYTEMEKVSAGAQEGLKYYLDAPGLPKSWGEVREPGEKAFKLGFATLGAINGYQEPARVQSIENINALKTMLDDREAAEKEAKPPVEPTPHSDPAPPKDGPQPSDPTPPKEDPEPKGFDDKSNDVCYQAECPPATNPAGCEADDDLKFNALPPQKRNPLVVTTFPIEGYDQKAMKQRSMEEVFAQIRSNLEKVARFQEVERKPKVKVDPLKDPIKDGLDPVRDPTVKNPLGPNPGGTGPLGPNPGAPGPFGPTPRGP